MELQEFYSEIARLLETEHEYHEPPKVFGGGRPRYDGTIRNTYKSRYNGREPGNGRFPGRGLVRVYSPSCVHITLTDPPLCGQYASLADALDAITRARMEQLTIRAHAEIAELLKDRPSRFFKGRSKETTDE